MCQAVTRYLCVTTRMDAHVHTHKINTDRETGNQGCSKPAGCSEHSWTLCALVKYRLPPTTVWRWFSSSVIVTFLITHSSQRLCSLTEPCECEWSFLTACETWLSVFRLERSNHGCYEPPVSLFSCSPVFSFSRKFHHSKQATATLNALC